MTRPTQPIKLTPEPSELLQELKRSRELPHRLVPGSVNKPDNLGQ